LKEQEIKAWNSQAHTALIKGQPRPAKPESSLLPPVLPRLFTIDATFESLHSVLSENPAGLFVIRDELTGWLAGLERQGREQERAFYLECWNGDASFTMDRIGRGNVHVPHACISLLGGIQPARLRQYLADVLRDGWSNDGLMQRFQLLVWPDAPVGWNYIDRKPNKAALEHASTVYRQIAAMNVASPLRLKFDDEAQALFKGWLADLESRLRADGLAPTMQSHLAKYRSLMPSLALLFALANGRIDCVTIAEARLACDWCDYLETHARRVYFSQARPENQAAIEMSRRLTKGWKHDEGIFTVRDVYRNEWYLLDSPDAVRSALLVLQDYGWVREEPDGNGKSSGRPSETYRINPKVGRKHAGE
jgi:putative DNA primase/helicase